MHDTLPEGYRLKQGKLIDQALLVRFMDLTYQELFPQQQDFRHLINTVQQYFSSDTPLWWVETSETKLGYVTPVACLWMGNAIDQVTGDRYTHIFLLFVKMEHRCRGIGTALMLLAQEYARQRQDKQIGLQVFTCNQNAMNLYQKLGYQPQSLLMLKSLDDNSV